MSEHDEKQTRRGFLISSAAAAALAAAAGMTGAAPAPEKASTKPGTKPATKPRMDRDERQRQRATKPVANATAQRG